MSAPDLSALRHAIDGVDSAIIALLVARRKLSTEAQRLKTLAGAAVVDEDRETEIIAGYESAAPGANDVACAVLLYCRGPQVRL